MTKFSTQHKFGLLGPTGLRLSLLALLACGAATADELPILPSRQNVFSIPFQVNRATDAKDAPAKVQLFVHTEESPQWEHHRTVEPATGSFEFSAPKDGHYWFAIRSVDQLGNMYPPGPIRPGLHVHVDTEPPRLQLNGTWNPSGDVVLHWEAADEQINANSLRLAFREGPAAEWQPLVVEPGSSTGKLDVCRGESRWWPQTAAEMLQVRGEVLDRAGNSTVQHEQLTRHAGQATERERADGPALSGTTTWPANHTATSPTTDPLADSPEDPQPSFPAQPSTEWPPTQISQQPLETGPSLGSQTNTNSGTQSTPIDPSHPWGHSPESVAGSPTAAADAASPSSRPPAGNQTHAVNSLRVELQYDLVGLNPLDVAQVEVWGTIDGGQRWESFGVDSDRRSPILVEVEEDGTYGFQISVSTHRSRSAAAPAKGDPPQILVVVDTARPVATLQARPGPRDDSGRTAILEWAASDRQLAERPIRLAYSGYPGGPWTTIARGIANTGSHRWTVGELVPAQVYLQLEVADEAGNMTVVQTPRPVSLSVERAQGRLRDARGTGAGVVTPVNR